MLPASNTCGCSKGVTRKRHPRVSFLRKVSPAISAKAVLAPFRAEILCIWRSTESITSILAQQWSPASGGYRPIRAHPDADPAEAAFRGGIPRVFRNELGVFQRSLEELAGKASRTRTWPAGGLVQPAPAFAEEIFGPAQTAYATPHGARVPRPGAGLLLPPAGRAASKL